MKSKEARRMFLILSLALWLAATNLVVGQQDGRGPNAADYIRSRGFKCEPYVVWTSGYPLTLYRIINPLANPDTLNRYPVLYGHGLWFDAVSMISRSENSRPRVPVLGAPTADLDGSIDGTDDYSLPFMLSNNNFDVWLFDARGTNDQNRDFLVSQSLSNAFWDYSLDEQALRDLPLLIDFVLSKTASQQLVYVGFSESTFFLFALLSKVPEYADKIVAALLMAPVAYVTQVKGVTIPFLAPLLLSPDNINRVALPTPLIDMTDGLLTTLCSQRALSKLICGGVSTAIGGIGASQNKPNFYQQFLKTTSIKAMKQFVQLFLGHRFGMYDYKAMENMRRYGQVEPPKYELSRLKSDRIILACGLSDWVANPDDVVRLVQEMGVKPYKQIIVPSFSHFDFIDGHDLIRRVNQPALETFYELMYKNGPDILKSREQIMATPGGQTTNWQFEPSEAALKAMSHLKLRNNNALDSIQNQVLSPFSSLIGAVASVFNLGQG